MLLLGAPTAQQTGANSSENVALFNQRPRDDLAGILGRAPHPYNLIGHRGRGTKVVCWVAQGTQTLGGKRARDRWIYRKDIGEGTPLPQRFPARFVDNVMGILTAEMGRKTHHHGLGDD